MRMEDFESTNEQALTAFESQVGQTLPTQYRRFLLETSNGGKPEGAPLFYVPDLNDWSDVMAFLGVGREAAYGLRYLNGADGSHFPEFWTFGYDSGGNHLLISNQDGSIWYCPLDLEEDIWPPRTFFVAPSFESFLEDLLTYSQLEMMKKEAQASELPIQPC